MRVLLAALAIVGCAGAPAPAPGRVVDEPTKVEEARPLPSVRWVLDRPVGVSLGRALDLGSGKSLLPGAEGQRWIRSGDSWSHAERPLPEDLVAVIEGPDHGFDFVGESGTVYRTKSPFGDVIETRPAKYDRATASSGAIVAMRSDRTLVRSTDHGATYAPLEVGEGRVLEVVLARNGSGLALLAPERVFVTEDHGATWRKVSLPDLEPEHVALADDGAPYVGSKAHGARLANGAFGPDSQVQAATEAGPPIGAIAVAGKRVVLVSHEERDSPPYAEPKVAVTTLGGARVYQSIAGLGVCAHVTAAVASDHVVVGCMRRQPDQLVVARSYDDGKTFRVEPPLAISVPTVGSRVVLAAGPKGMLVYADDDKTRLIKKEGDVPVEIGENLVVSAALVDEPRRRIVLAGRRLSITSLDGGNVEDRGIVGDPDEKARIAVDDGGKIHLAHAGRQGLHVFADGVITRHRFTSARFALHGARGLFAIGPRLYETSDGGEHLREIGRAPGGPFACSAEGCAFAAASRIGWSESGTPIDEESLVEPSTAVKRPPPKTVVCTAVGKPLAVAVNSPAPDVQLAPSPRVPFRVPTKTGIVSVSYEKPKLTTLFAPTTRKAMVVFHSVSDGFVAMRYLVAPKTANSQGLRAVSAELAWKHNDEKMVHKGALGEVGTFRVEVGAVLESLRWPYAAGIVDGGVIVRPTHPRIVSPRIEIFDFDEAPAAVSSEESGREPFYFLHDDGKIEKIQPPAGDIEFASVFFRGKDRWYLVSRTDAVTATIWISSDRKGSSWQRRTVRLWEGAANVTLNTVGGRPVFVVVPRESKRGFVATLSLDGSRELDVRSFGIPSLDRAHACSGSDLLAVRASVPAEELEASFGDARLGMTHWVLMVPQTGDACVSALGGEDGELGLFIPLDKPRRSLWFVRGKHVQSADCAL